MPSAGGRLRLLVELRCKDASSVRVLPEVCSMNAVIATARSCCCWSADLGVPDLLASESHV